MSGLHDDITPRKYVRRITWAYSGYDVRTTNTLVSDEAGSAGALGGLTGDGGRGGVLGGGWFGWIVRTVLRPRA